MNSCLIIRKQTKKKFTDGWLEASKVKQIALLVHLIQLKAYLDEPVAAHRLSHSQIVDARVVVLPFYVARFHGLEHLVHDVLRLRLRSDAQMPFGFFYRLFHLVRLRVRMRSPILVQSS